MMYWTDRGDPPRGNTVNRAPMDSQAGRREDPDIIFNHLMEGIGLALDLDNARMFLTDLGGSVYRCDLDGSGKEGAPVCGRKLERHCLRGNSGVALYGRDHHRAFRQCLAGPVQSAV